MPLLRVHLLGGLHIEQDGTPLPLPATHHARLLLAYLLLYPQRAHTRALLAGLLWPDLPETDARRRLRQTLWQMRRCFPYLTSNRQAVQVLLRDELWVDVVAFRQALAQAERAESDFLRKQAWEDAILCYGGPLLPGFYEDWVLLERERLHQQYLQALDALLQYHMREGRYEAALALARRLVQEEPLNEDAHRQIIRLCALLGQHEDAFAQYEELRQILEQTLGTQPDAQTESLMRRIRDQSPTEAPSAPALLFENIDALPLIGREEAWAQAQVALKRLRQGRGGILVVRGETGIGKTRFLAELALHGEWSGMQVWSGRASQENYLEPYHLWRQVFRSHLTPLRAEQLAMELDPVLLAALTAILPELKHWLPQFAPVPMLPGEEAQQRLELALRHFLRASARRTPLLILLDDSQWADTTSLQVIHHLSEETVQHPILLVLGFRDDEILSRRRMEALLQNLPIPPQEIALDHLSPQATERLIQASLGISYPIPHFSGRIYRATQGHPLFVLETLRALHQQGTLFRNAQGRWSTHLDETTEDYAELPLTNRLQALYEQRLAQLSPVAWEIMAVASLVSMPLTPRFLQRTLDATPQAIVRGTEELVSLRLLREETRGLRLAHDSLREVVSTLLPQEEVQQWHRHIARALEIQGDVPPAILAYHFEQGELLEDALRYHRLAARQARNLYAYPHVREHLDAAIRLATSLHKPQDLLYRLLAQREEALSILGERDAQAQDLDRMDALAGLCPERKIQVLLRRARYASQTSRYEEAQHMIQEALALARENNNPQWELQALLEQSHAFILSGRSQDALTLTHTMLPLASRVQDARLQALVYRELGDAFLGVGQHVRAREYLEQALSLFESIKDPLEQIRTIHLLAILVTEQGELDEARAYYRREIELSRGIGYLAGISKAELNLGNLDWLEGRAYQALQRYTRARELFQPLRNPRAEITTLANSMNVWMDLFGACPEAQELLEIGMAKAERLRESPTLAHMYALKGEFELHAGRAHEALPWLQRSVHMLEEAGQRWMAQQGSRIMARIFLALEEPAQALDALKRGQRHGQALGLGEPDLSDAALLALTYARLKQACQAQRYLEEVARRVTPQTYQSHLIAHWCAQASEELGQSDQAQTWRLQAWEWLQSFLKGLPPDWRKRSVEEMPYHRAIAQAIQQDQHQHRVRLPRHDAPTGRPLREDEWVEVIWTPSLPEDDRIPSKVERRRQRVLRLLREAKAQGAAPTVEHLAQALNVSPATIKRDLAALRRAGHSTPTRGNR